MSGRDGLGAKRKEDAGLNLRRKLIDSITLSTLIKLLTFQTYRSTDFEVHRNWLAVTNSLPISEWYYDETSQWTLDYPPFFGYFEWVLSKLAEIVDREIVRLDNLNYQSFSCVVFQRSTVVITEFVLISAVYKSVRDGSDQNGLNSSFSVIASLIFHPGLIIVDHIHFQYNGFLLGILLWSVWAIREERYNLSAFLFTSLLNFKHIYLYLSPPFFIYLLRVHCTKPGQSLILGLSKLIQLGLIVVGTCVLSFGPFVLSSGSDGLIQIFGRLFPFQRGLNHAYWAANVWSLYSTLDRVLVKYMVYKGRSIDPIILNSNSRGLVGDTLFGVLPKITPRICFSLTLTFNLIIMGSLWFRPTYNRFLKSIVLSGFTSFLFGWHVHEKAALLFLIPLTLIAMEDYYHFRSWIIASSSGIFGLFPLLINPMETPIKIIYSLVWFSCVSSAFKKNLHRPKLSSVSLLIIYLEKVYLIGFVFLQLYQSVVHSMIFKSNEKLVSDDGKRIDSMEFLPLMMISVYCGLGIIWSYLRLLKAYLNF
ncbi:glycosyl transferase [Phakopsora pachyrhizi]|uniref:Alpha-1,3-glucosyltransferase n=1 Tax=Phakopsora pachyrhizi TaxID=170000 RepID=A0AAV0BKX3_PHAPC|nr:glycosyl transferase [Phakopsora pachyrhizi]